MYLNIYKSICGINFSPQTEECKTYQFLYFFKLTCFLTLSLHPSSKTVKMSI